VANSFRAKLLNKKAAFAVLSDPGFSGMFSPDEQRAVAAHVPWTRRVRPGRTRWRGREVDLPALLVDEREHLVLKPNDEYGGKGVLLGWHTPPEIWRAAIEGATRETMGATRETMIVQERKLTQTMSLPTSRDGHLVNEEVYADLCPFLFAGRVEGAMVRVSSSALTNVSTGGGVTGLLIVDGASDRARDTPETTHHV
jgi:hypothetical protein